MSLLSTGFLASVVTVVAVCLVLSVPWEDPARWRVVLRAGLATAVLTGITALALWWSGVFATGVPGQLTLWLAVVLLAPALTVAAWRQLRWRRVLPIVGFLAALVMTATLLNDAYAYYPTLGSIFAPPVGTVSSLALARDRASHRPWTTGRVVQMDVPGTVSHFHARPAWVWLPPVYFDQPTERLPVVELLGGTPGSPSTWVTNGGAAGTADAFAATHGGIAPIVVMPDSNGSLWGDSECVNSTDGQVETYLTVDVPAFARRVLDSASGVGSLAVAGLSEGGSCSVMLALRHPHEYAAFGDYSGLAAPSVENVVAPAATTRALFGGSTTAYEAHDPAFLLHRGRFRPMAGWFEVGGTDTPCLDAQAALAALARRAGITVATEVDPGQGHSFAVWRDAFQHSLPFLAAHLALPRAV